MLRKYIYCLQCKVINIINLEYLLKQNLKVNVCNECRELFQSFIVDRSAVIIVKYILGLLTFKYTNNLMVIYAKNCKLPNCLDILYAAT